MATRDGELFDLLCRDFGVGDWDEATSDVPYWKWRVTEVAKVKRVRVARKVTIENLFLAAEYAKVTGRDVRDATWLYPYILDAIKWDKERAAAGGELETQMATAVDEAMSAGDMEWVGRLTRANGPARAEVLAAWQHR